MDSLAKIYIERAENELLLAKINLDISTKEELKGILGIKKVIPSPTYNTKPPIQTFYIKP